MVWGTEMSKTAKQTIQFLQHLLSLHLHSSRDATFERMTGSKERRKEDEWALKTRFFMIARENKMCQLGPMKLKDEAWGKYTLIHYQYCHCYYHFHCLNFEGGAKSN